MALSFSRKLSALLRGTKLKHDDDFYCLNGPHLFITKNKFESHKKVCENENFWGAVMLSEDTKILVFHTKILVFHQYRKSDKTPSSNYADLESLM